MQSGMLLWLIGVPAPMLIILLYLAGVMGPGVAG